MDALWVTARWTAPDGEPQRGVVAVGLDAKAGQTVDVWLTQSGQLTGQRLSRGGLFEREVLAAIGAPVALAVLMAVVAWVIRAAAGRRRMASWTKAWDVVGPRWSTRR